jgi:hypothetical protein
MGMDLILECRPEIEVGQGWTETDGKQLIDVLLLSIELIEKHLQVDLSPLKKTAGDEPAEEDLEEVAEMTGQSPQEMLKDVREQNEAAWQAPNELAASLRSLIKGLGNRAQNLPLAKLEKNHPDRSYFEKGDFLADLQDLLRWTEGAQKAGAKQVRIYIV